MSEAPSDVVELVQTLSPAIQTAIENREWSKVIDQANLTGAPLPPIVLMWVADQWNAEREGRSPLRFEWYGNHYRVSTSLRRT